MIYVVKIFNEIEYYELMRILLPKYHWLGEQHIYRGDERYIFIYLEPKCLTYSSSLNFNWSQNRSLMRVSISEITRTLSFKDLL